MGNICRITIVAFIYGDIPKGIEHGYDNWDLENAINYCNGLIEEGFTHEPMDDFNLKDFIVWAKNKIKE